MFFSAVIIRAFVAELQARGFGTTQAYQALGVSQHELNDVRTRLPAAEMNRIVVRALRASADPGLGLTMGSRSPDNMLQMLGPLLLSARSLRHAFSLFQRYVPLLADGMSWALVEEGEQAMFIHRCGGAPVLNTRFAAEYVLATIMHVAGKLVPRASAPSRVMFQHAEPEYAARYAEIFNCPISFDYQFNALVCERSLLDVPHPYADATVHDVVLELAERTLAQLDTPKPSLRDRIALLLQHDIDAAALSVRDLAHQLGLTTRQLRRRLALEGGTISDLINEARQAHACAELRHGRSIQDVADRLGFAERSAFHRAFKRWTGQTPQQYSAQHRLRSWTSWT